MIPIEAQCEHHRDDDKHEIELEKSRGEEEYILNNKIIILLKSVGSQKKKKRRNKELEI